MVVIGMCFRLKSLFPVEANNGCGLSVVSLYSSINAF